MEKNTKQCFEFNRTDRLRRTIFLEDSSEDDLFENNNKTKTREGWNKPPATLIKPKPKVKVGCRPESLPISMKSVKIIKKRKPVTDRLITVKTPNLKPKQAEPNIIKVENKQLVNQTPTKIKKQV